MLKHTNSMARVPSIDLRPIFTKPNMMPMMAAAVSPNTKKSMAHVAMVGSNSSMARKFPLKKKPVPVKILSFFRLTLTEVGVTVDTAVEWDVD